MRASSYIGLNSTENKSRKMGSLQKHKQIDKTYKSDEKCNNDDTVVVKEKRYAVLGWRSIRRLYMDLVQYPIALASLKVQSPPKVKSKLKTLH